MLRAATSLLPSILRSTAPSRLLPAVTSVRFAGARSFNNQQSTATAAAGEQVSNLNIDLKVSEPWGTGKGTTTTTSTMQTQQYEQHVEMIGTPYQEQPKTINERVRNSLRETLNPQSLRDMNDSVRRAMRTANDNPDQQQMAGRSAQSIENQPQLNDSATMKQKRKGKVLDDPLVVRSDLQHMPGGDV
eukprot:TRINITY_DN10842_c0_g1_i1.p1 TRINITY_DN10842_c0_g1~~TRINITY_DN10842_c0_g1_i1.p1  ORF type:complete len:188 (-),score=63.19 TRINITY_DN10842_c0_g1_i1:6-569(-)